jgi:ankyrin repeat protein
MQLVLTQDWTARKLVGSLNERLYGWDLKEFVESMMNMDWMHEEEYEQQRSDSGTIKIRISPESMAIINGEFLRLKEFDEVKLDADIRDYLEDAHSSFKSMSTLNPRESKFKKSLVHYAAMGDCSELLRFLLANGAARDDRDQNSRTPLSWAAEYVALDSVRILLDDGAEINSMDDMLLTPLSWLVHAGVTTSRLAATEAYMRERGAMLNPEEDQNALSDF